MGDQIKYNQTGAKWEKSKYDFSIQIFSLIRFPIIANESSYHSLSGPPISQRVCNPSRICDSGIFLSHWDLHEGVHFRCDIGGPDKEWYEDSFAIMENQIKYNQTGREGGEWTLAFFERSYESSSCSSCYQKFEPFTTEWYIFAAMLSSLHPWVFRFKWHNHLGRFCWAESIVLERVPLLG